MNSGVGFLLRVTDVERQPFRSMGFVSIIIVSVLFAMGLPLVRAAVGGAVAGRPKPNPQAVL